MVLGGVKAAWLLVCAAALGAHEDTTGKAEVTGPACLVLSRKGLDLSWWMLPVEQPALLHYVETPSLTSRCQSHVS